MAVPFCEGRTDCTTLLGVLAFAAVVLAPAPLGAQFSSGVNVVEVYAAVTDANGNPVTGLHKEDFTVLEDGRAQTVSTFAEADFPLAVAVAIDRSFSMAPRRGDRSPAVLPAAGAAAFLGELRSPDQAMVVAIGSEVEIVSPLSSDRPSQIAAARALTPWGTTGLYDAIIQSLDAIQSAKGRRAMVLLSDGTDRYSKATADDALARARRSDVMVYPVTIGAAQPAVFSEIATLTGGRTFHPRTPAELDAAMRTIANELRHQYLLGYAPSQAIAGGSEQWRAIAVRVNRADVRVRARDGYFSR